MLHPSQSKNLTSKLWGQLAFDAIVIHKVSNYQKLVDMEIVMVFDNVEDEKIFSIVNFLKSKVHNLLATDLDLVVCMDVQQFYGIKTFPFYSII